MTLLDAVLVQVDPVHALNWFVDCVICVPLQLQAYVDGIHAVAAMSRNAVVIVVAVIDITI